MTHEMKLQKEPFEMIKNGYKTIELRLYDEKRKLINIGDIIKFTLIDGNDSLTVKVVELHLFDSFKTLYANLSIKKCGYKNIAEAKPQDMEKFYSKQEQLLFGVVGIEFELLKN